MRWYDSVHILLSFWAKFICMCIYKYVCLYVCTWGRVLIHYFWRRPNSAAAASQKTAAIQLSANQLPQQATSSSQSTGCQPASSGIQQNRPTSDHSKFTINEKLSTLICSQTDFLILKLVPFTIKLSSACKKTKCFIPRRIILPKTSCLTNDLTDLESQKAGKI